MSKKLYYERPQLEVVELKVASQILAGSTLNASGTSTLTGMEEPEDLD